MHLLITYSGLDIKRTIKWLAQQTTKAVHKQTNHKGPVWWKDTGAVTCLIRITGRIWFNTSKGTTCTATNPPNHTNS